VRLTRVDERDTAWDTATPTLRAYFWTRDRSSVDCIEVAEATVPDGVAWAEGEARARNAELDLAVVAADADGLRGLIWLRGTGDSGRPS
jgi:hypothetical protein